MITAVDTNILIDILEPDPVFGPASREALKRCLREGAIIACAVVWAEVATAYGEQVQRAEAALDAMGIQFSPGSREDALEAACRWHKYRQRGGTRSRIAADFLIGGNALVHADRLLTRDGGFFSRHFRPLKLVVPAASPSPPGTR